MGKTNRDLINEASNKKLAKFIVRYTNCNVCVVKDTCPHAPGHIDPKAEHYRDQACADRIEEWLEQEVSA